MTIKLNIPKVSNMVSNQSGKEVPNQFLIQNVRIEHEGILYDGSVFQSYNSVIAFQSNDRFDPLTLLDERYWDFSKTTGIYRNQFLGDRGIAETRKHIQSGKYKLVNLN